MVNYSFEIPNEKAKIYRIITMLMLLINLVAFVFVVSKSWLDLIKWIAIAGGIVNIIAVIISYKKEASVKKGKAGFYAIEKAFIFSALCWALIGNFFASGLLLLFAVFGFYTNRKFIIQFSEEGISYPSFPPKIFLWKDVEQALLKDDILTIDLKDNRLLQFSIDKKLCTVVDEDEFNKFCSRQMI
ncbi:MAG: hypothetical protein ABI091_29680 [Ferruginibacter sp.]